MPCDHRSYCVSIKTLWLGHADWAINLTSHPESGFGQVPPMFASFWHQSCYNLDLTCRLRSQTQFLDLQHSDFVLKLPLASHD